MAKQKAQKQEAVEYLPMEDVPLEDVVSCPACGTVFVQAKGDEDCPICKGKGNPGEEDEDDNWWD
ncbi:MAG: hypothetical protein GTO12_16190 [Proteobacteria bacterium]|nr:hypothetical protein [Pseudomonadota bacterium]